MNEQEVGDMLESIINRCEIWLYIYEHDELPLVVREAKITLLEDMATDAQDIVLGFCIGNKQ